MHLVRDNCMIHMVTLHSNCMPVFNEMLMYFSLQLKILINITDCNYKCPSFSFQHNWRHKRCQFREILTEDRFTEFRLRTNESWYIGFRHNGRPINATRPRKRSKCYQFTPIPVPANPPRPHGPLNGIDENGFYALVISKRHERTRTRRARRPRQT